MTQRRISLNIRAAHPDGPLVIMSDSIADVITRTADASANNAVTADCTANMLLSQIVDAMLPYAADTAYRKEREIRMEIARHSKWSARLQARLICRLLPLISDTSNELARTNKLKLKAEAAALELIDSCDRIDSMSRTYACVMDTTDPRRAQFRDDLLCYIADAIVTSSQYRFDQRIPDHAALITPLAEFRYKKNSRNADPPPPFCTFVRTCRPRLESAKQSLLTAPHAASRAGLFEFSPQELVNSARDVILAPFITLLIPTAFAGLYRPYFENMPSIVVSDPDRASHDWLAHLGPPLS